MIKTFDEVEVFTGMCLWEAWQDLIADNRHAHPSYAAEHALEVQERRGSWDTRQMLVDCIKDCDEAWKLAYALSPDGYDGSFDWDFVPAWLAGAIESGRLD